MSSGSEKMKKDTARFTLDMLPELRRRLKIIATLKGRTMRAYCLSAIETQIARDEAEISDAPSLRALEQSSASEAPDLDQGAA